MRNAPSVVFPVGRSAFQGQVLLLLGAVALMTWTGWWIAPRSTSDTMLGVGVAGLLAWGLWGMWAWRSWRQAPLGHLSWDAKAARIDEPLRAGAWRWCDVDAPDGVPLLDVELALDLQTRVLLKLHLAERRSCTWVWVERSVDPLRWNDLRRALVGARH